MLREVKEEDKKMIREKKWKEFFCVSSKLEKKGKGKSAEVKEKE